MDIVRSVADLRARVRGWHARGERVALTPTMGALHDGHLSLVALGQHNADRVVATIFVNPTQFGANEDLDGYPRNEARDADLLSRGGCDLLFAPAVGEMYPPGFSTRVIVDGLTDVLCGAVRPGHFDGVAQVVTKLLNQAQADVAIFGEKDWQQLAVIRRLTRDLDIPTEILGAPILREPDGLAMSSRNRYLTADERAVAGTLNQALREAAQRIVAGQDIPSELAAARAAILGAGFASIDYVELREADTLAEVVRFDPTVPTRIFGAARLGRARLIDNMPVEG
ncbi:pantoate--beta-alanine ligase [Limibaculum sp. M0105]|uniref:Pantothenate synthetase n=1 Tax=Thermohalobaculum xanthum TaxID=2753746 RepID=A0A8J7MAX8_9RHOB|nr:pantoate--beta-alanine ligase [Thermohalobaculum xanthum]MBK0400749.1 pantoate--beta-alanine ligase [Thermohalobaculum xanthum]